MYTLTLIQIRALLVLAQERASFELAAEDLGFLFQRLALWLLWGAAAGSTVLSFPRSAFIVGGLTRIGRGGMKPRICICCGEPIGTSGLSLSRNPNVCASCSSMADGMEDSAAGGMLDGACTETIEVSRAAHQHEEQINMESDSAPPEKPAQVVPSLSPRS